MTGDIITEKERLKILDHLISLSQFAPPPPNSFYIQDYVTRSGLSESGAKARLQHLVKQGIVGTKIILDPETHHRKRAYWPIN